MELKLTINLNKVNHNASSNRTFMELKLVNQKRKDMGGWF